MDTDGLCKGDGASEAMEAYGNGSKAGNRDSVCTVAV
jgi:hypothetical protein